MMMDEVRCTLYDDDVSDDDHSDDGTDDNNQHVQST